MTFPSRRGRQISSMDITAQRRPPLGRRLPQARRVRHWNQFIDSVEHLTHGPLGRVRADEDRWSGCGNPEIPLHFDALLKYHVQGPPSRAPYSRKQDTPAATVPRQSGWCTPLLFPTLLKYTVRYIDIHMANWKVIALVNGEIEAVSGPGAQDRPGAHEWVVWQG